MDELQFRVEVDEEGNYCASANVADGLLATDARDMDNLLVMLKDLIALYADELGIEQPAFSLHFPSSRAA